MAIRTLHHATSLHCLSCFIFNSLAAVLNPLIASCSTWGNKFLLTFRHCRVSSVGIATRYRLEGSWIESRWGVARVSCPPRPSPGAHPASYTMGTGSFPGVKRPERGVDHPPPSSAEVKERVELYFHPPYGPSWPVLGRTLLYFYLTFRRSALPSTAVRCHYISHC